MEKKQAAPSASWSIARLLRDVPVPAKYRASLRGKQLETVGNMVFVMMLANLVNVAVVLLSFQARC
jgi:hypothetical protein